MLPDLDIELLPGMKDTHIWRLSSASGQHTEKSTYEGLFQGAILFRLWERIWKIRALRRCQKKSCGSLLIAGAGLLIDLLDMECHTLLAVLYAIRRKKQSITCSVHVSSRNNFGCLPFLFILNVMICNTPKC